MQIIIIIIQYNSGDNITYHVLRYGKTDGDKNNTNNKNLCVSYTFRSDGNEDKKEFPKYLDYNVK